MKRIEYNENKRIVRVQGGALWRDVYSALEPYGVVVAGARAASVGVGGFLLGGGHNF